MVKDTIHCWNCERAFADLKGAIYEIWAHYEDGESEQVMLLCANCYKYKKFPRPDQ